ncbi:MAG: hypothetical protein A3J74_02030 [Elusimicrobia bacterium RIFCSPHIGHO2_02_FULL_57_9]|nr:MAG: hypothetical protein A3J74_02030 [Elusimicrobia bacterium RIFCSPHIGHO2_02_FULL_57_9]
MLKRLFLLFALVSSTVPAFADQYGAFEQYADGSSIKPFTRDLGGVLGSATFHSARSLGFSGFDIGLRGGMQFSPDRDNLILRNRGVKVFGLPWMQAEIGLPFKFDGFIRGISYQGLTIAGGGLRYGLRKLSDTPWSPQMLFSAVGHSVVHQHFSASQAGGSLVVSAGIPVFTPYAGGGFDRTRLVVRSSTLDPNFNGSVVTTIQSRYTAGMQFRPWTFFYIHLAYVLLHGQSGSEAGMGLRF